MLASGVPPPPPVSDLTSGVLAAGEVSSISADDDSWSVGRTMPALVSSSISDVEEAPSIGMAPSACVLRRGGALGAWSTPASMAQQRKRP